MIAQITNTATDQLIYYDTNSISDGVIINRGLSYLDREQYEEDLKRKQQEHLDSIQGQNDMNWRPCMHDQCTECHGTGVRRFGGMCIHSISCPCPKCTPYC